MLRHRISILCLSLCVVAACASKKGVVIGETNKPLPEPSQANEVRILDDSGSGVGTEDLETGLGQELRGRSESSPLADIYFEFDRYDLSADARALLKRNAMWLRAHPSERVLIEGHCDDRGTEEYNLALGDRRSQSVRRFLSDLGIPASRFTTISFGEAKPITRGASESDMARNRRVHFHIMKEE